MRLAVDLDGVVWRGSLAIPGAAEAVHRLTAAGHELVFVTNHALSPAAKAGELARHGIDGAVVVTSAEAAAYACRTASSVAVLGDPTLVAVLADAGLDARDLRDGPPGAIDAVVVGAHHDWDRDRIGRAADAIRAGARFVATNDDPTFPVSDDVGEPRLLPGNGALVAAVAVASGATPLVAGKPFDPMVGLLTERHGRFDLVVGDQPSTDGRLAAALGASFALVLTGVTTAADLPVDPAPAIVTTDFADLAASICGP